MNDYDHLYCDHGTYVGGCGADFMCGWCEDGVSWADYTAFCNRETRKRTHENMVATFFSAMPLNPPAWALNLGLGLLKAPLNARLGWVG